MLEKVVVNLRPVSWSLVFGDLDKFSAKMAIF
jgi:hypothetical protein